ncbi:MAG TPA: hypothetical protein VHK26_12525 [Methyloceanibacter sp.]|nr:hypothetical protein [Methyloceanibacter sp.]
MEVQSGPYFDEDDIVRCEDISGRTSRLERTRLCRSRTSCQGQALVRPGRATNITPSLLTRIA